MNKYIDAEKLIAEIEKLLAKAKNDEEKAFVKKDAAGHLAAVTKTAVCIKIKKLITSLQQEQPDEQPEYGYLSTEYVYGKKSRWSVGDVLAYYICTSNEEGEDVLGKIVNVEFNEEDEWIYTFEDESTWDEQSLVEEGAYKKN